MKMTVNAFVNHYKDESIMTEPLNIGTTSLRNYIKENKEILVKQNIVKFIKKLKTETIEILQHEELYKKLA